MKRTLALSLSTLAVIVGALVHYTPTASTSSSNQTASVSRNAGAASYLLPPAPTILTVDRADDTAAATACTGAANDCSLRGAVINANTNVSADPVIINLQSATTYNLTLTNAIQENAALTGDLDITTLLHSVTIVGGGSSGPNMTIINASGLNSVTMSDRAFQITASGANATFQDLVIQNGRAADDGSAGASTNPDVQNFTRAGGCILNGAGVDVTGNAVMGSGGGSVTLTNVVVQSCQAVGKGDFSVNNFTALEALGGGLASVGAASIVVITNSTFTGNAALGGDSVDGFNNGNGSSARGGSLYFQGATLTISDTRFSQSSATGGEGGSMTTSNQENGGAGGYAHGGGAYIGSGTASINNTTFENCSADGGDSGEGQQGTNTAAEGGGGGLYSRGDVTVTNSTFNLNTATGGDSGDSFGPDCFGAHQSGDGGAARGGAILAEAGSLIINTATLSSNAVTGGNGGDGGKTNGGSPCAGTSHGAGGIAHGGAVTNTFAATLNIKHATISLNSAQAGNTGVNQAGATLPPRVAAEGTGGGIRVGPAGVTLENTIVAGNTAANGLGDPPIPTPGPNVDGNITSLGHNLLGVAAEATGFTGPGDQTGANPMLAALADNGGPTKTMALTVGSPAIDAGFAAGSTFDQRGLLRIYDDPGVVNAATSDAADIGAFELQPLCSLTCPLDIVVPNAPDQCGANVAYPTPEGSGCGTLSFSHPSGSFFPVGQTTVTITSSAGPTCTFKVTVNDTQNPAITAPDDASYQCASEVPPASPGQATATDNCSGVSVGVNESNNGGAGSPSSPLIITRTYTATDAAGLTASDSQTITVIDNTPPTIACPPNITVDADPGICSTAVSFSVSANDNCSSANVVTTHASGSTFAVGTTTVTATATDAAGNTNSCTFTVTVKDVEPPIITTNGQTITLWSPNHTYQTISVTDFVTGASDPCDPSVGLDDVVIASVTSDEPNNSAGDGNTVNDIVIAADCKTVQLRSERMGGGNGRVYTITFEVTDSSGNTSTATAKVTVPKSQNGEPAVDDGPSYLVNSACP